MINTTKFEKKKILIVGLGRSGIAALNALVSLGAYCAVQDSKNIEATDIELRKMIEKNNITCYLGTLPETSEKFDIVLLSPGVSPELPFIKDLKSRGCEMIGELELAFEITKGKFIAITGTNGKTTTTTLVGEIFKNAQKDFFVAGNIGRALTSIAHETSDSSWIIAETSSFQLETTKTFRPYISVFLNITPDHLDRHKNMKNYIDAKARIFENQDKTDYFVVNYDDKNVYERASDCKAKVVPFSRLAELEYGVYVKNNKIVVRTETGEVFEVCRADEVLIQGNHNLENALAGTACAYFAGISIDVIAKTLKEFPGVEHRLEFCRELSGVKFINDSKGTNPDASVKALEAVKEPIILIAGGYDKKLEFDEFIEAFKGKVKHLVLLGTTAEKIEKTAKSKGFEDSVILKSMEECVAMAFELAKPGYTVLLSPACASNDMYANFEERGKHFKDCVARLEVKC